MSAVEQVESAESPEMEDRVLRALGVQEPKKPEPQKPEAPAEQPATQEATEGATEAAEPTDNLIEIDFKGGKYKLPPELKDLHEGYLRQEDYTRKTQEVAERQRVIDLMEQQARHRQELQQATAPYLEQIMSLNSQISQYAKVDWGALSDQDPQHANKHWMAYQTLKERKQTLEREMQGAAAQHLSRFSESVEKLKGENSKILSEKVKGWGAERDQKVRNFASEHYGFSKNEVSQVFDARILRLMNDAYELQALRDAKPVKQPLPAQRTLKPNATEAKPREAVVRAELKKDIRNAKTDASKARGIQRLLERVL